MVKRYYYDEIPKAFLLLTRKVQLVEYKDYEALEKEVWELRNENAGMDVIKQKLTDSKSEIADLRSIEREHIKTIAELETKLSDVLVVLEYADKTLYQHKDSVKKALKIIKALTEGEE